jgi:CPA2 family monovalent cation:H+ antiporter-2
MPHDAALIATVAVGLGVAFVLGLAAMRLGLPPLVGYLVAGIVVGPFTPGIVADSGLTSQLAELGVVLLMFGVGLHFSLRDLAAVRRVVVPGAIAQTAITGTLGAALGYAWGLGAGGAAVLGLALGVASTVVLLKNLEQHDRVDSAEGRLGIGWLVVEDLMMVLALVLLPAIAPALRHGGASTPGAAALAIPLVIAVGKIGLFAALMFFVGRRFVPWLLEHVARVGSRELFTLAVLGTALGVATLAAELFGVSFALGAFFAGVVIGESELSHRAAADALPMQDAFAVLFFVSVGMLFDPTVLLRHPMRLLALVAIIVCWKSTLSFVLMRLFRQPPKHALVVAAALGQIGEFSFIVAALGVSLGLVTRDVQALVIAAALIAITLNGPVVSAAMRLARRADVRPVVERRSGDVPRAASAPSDTERFSELSGHVVLVGHGRVGTTVADALVRAGARYVIVEEQERIVEGLRKRGERAVQGDATRTDVLERAGIAGAQLLVVTAPEPFRARRIVEVARAANPGIAIAVRTHSAAEQAFFEQYLAAPGSTGRAVYSEREAALSLAHFALLTLGNSDEEADQLVAAIRGQPTRPTETFKTLPTQEYQALTRTAARGGSSE